MTKRSWLDALTANNGGMERARQEREAQIALTMPRARIVESCWVTLRHPNGDPGDRGSIEPCHWFVEDGMLYLSTEQGDVLEGVKPYRLDVGENPKAVAGRLAKRKREAASAASVAGFDGPVRYREPSGVV